MSQTLQEKQLGYTQLVPFKHGLAKQVLVLKNDPHASETVRLYGEYSEAEVRVFEKFVKPGDTVIDAGALFGFHTLALAELVGPEGWVYAFEPQRIPFQVLCGNVQLNSLANVIAHNIALGDRGYSSTIMRELDPHQPAAWGMERTDQGGKHDPLVPRHFLDDVYFRRPPTFIKIDVEADEPEVLMGGHNILREFHPVLYLEYQSNRAEILNILRHNGYDRLYLHKAPADPRDTGVPMLLAIPPGKEVEDEWLRQEGFQSI